MLLKAIVFKLLKDMGSSLIHDYANFVRKAVEYKYNLIRGLANFIKQVLTIMKFPGDAFEKFTLIFLKKQLHAGIMFQDNYNNLYIFVVMMQII